MGDETSLRDEISFLRQMAESGRRGPILGGIFLAGAGVVFGGASFLDGAMQTGLVPFRISEGALWIGASLVFAAFWLAMFLRMMRNQKPVGTAQSSMFGTIWSACGAGVMVCFLTTLLIAHNAQLPVLKAAYVPVIYAFYGTAWFASGALARRRWMFLAGLGSYLFAFIVASLVMTPWLTIVMGIGLILLLTVPGLKLATDEAKS
jgi:formate-dependent nitrite reductase membrane component NrfD